MGDDAQEVMEGNHRLDIFPDNRGVDEFHRELLMSTLDDSIVQGLLQMLCKLFALTMHRLLVDHLPGGIHHSVTDLAVVDETKSVLTTNVNPEHDFAVLIECYLRNLMLPVPPWSPYCFSHTTKLRIGYKVSQLKSESDF